MTILPIACVCISSQATYSKGERGGYFLWNVPFTLFYVNVSQVINPLPSLDDSCDKPIAKALFDFEDEQEQDLLSFKQVLEGNISSFSFPPWL